MASFLSIIGAYVPLPVAPSQASHHSAVDQAPGAIPSQPLVPPEAIPSEPVPPGLQTFAMHAFVRPTIFALALSYPTTIGSGPLDHRYEVLDSFGCSGNEAKAFVQELVKTTDAIIHVFVHSATSFVRDFLIPLAARHVGATESDYDYDDVRDCANALIKRLCLPANGAPVGKPMENFIATTQRAIRGQLKEAKDTKERDLGRLSQVSATRHYTRIRRKVVKKKRRSNRGAAIGDSEPEESESESDSDEDASSAIDAPAGQPSACEG